MGVAYCKAAAKIASEEKKPNGYFEIPDAESFVNLIIDRSVSVLYTVGAKTAEKLHAVGIRTVRDIQTRREEVIRLLGKQGRWITQLADGIDRRKVTPYRPEDAKSIGKELTFQEDVDNPALLKDSLLLLSLSVDHRAKKVGLYGSGVTLKLTYADMKSMQYRLAIDIGASSGRHIVGWMEEGELKTEEVYRFPNGVREQDGHLTWDVDALLNHVKAGIDRALERFGSIESLSVDTWGCDYVLLRGDQEVWPCYAYRDHRTEAIHEEVHARISFSELYRRTGCQFQLFNTVYQLCADREAGRLEGMTAFLMIPEYLLYKLTGVKAKEYTNATTTGLVNAETGAFDREIIARLGLPEGLFPKLRQPGTEIGSYKGIRVVFCATHDTASAVEGIPMKAMPVVADDHIGHTAKREGQNAPWYPEIARYEKSVLEERA